MQTVTPEEVLC